jgi:HAD superfamily hydrolase (TIGR01509 family)
MVDRPFDVVLFDLGGVLIELGGVTSLQEMGGLASDEAVWQKWLTSPWVQRFESGGCSPLEFSAGVVTEWGLPVSPERFLEIFRDWPIGPMAGASELLAEVQREVPTGCLSNTNTMHWEHQFVRWPILGVFDYQFLSFDLGLVKPDPAVFRAVTDRLAVNPDRILFLDDNILNTDAAQAFGFRSARVNGVDEARRVLVELGVISR